MIPDGRVCKPVTHYGRGPSNSNTVHVRYSAYASTTYNIILCKMHIRIRAHSGPVPPPPAFASVPHQHLRQTLVALTCPRSSPAWPHASRPPLTSSRAPPLLSTRTALRHPPSRLSRPAAPSSPRTALAAQSTASRPSSNAAPRTCRMRLRWARLFVWRIWCVSILCLLFFHELPLGFILANCYGGFLLHSRAMDKVGAELCYGREKATLDMRATRLEVACNCIAHT